MNYLFELQNVNKIYQVDDRRREHILKDISLKIHRGEFVSLMGPSGSGKSTLLYCMSGMDTISSGHIFFNEIEVSHLSETHLASIRLNKMGFIFQQPYLLKNLSLFDNIVLSAYLAKTQKISTIREKALDLMHRMKITELAHRDITQASGGQLQRVSICRALINNPDILFGDEPTGALNSSSANDVMDILLAVNQSGTTIFLVTHDVSVASKSERVLYMLDGRIVAECYLGKYLPQEQLFEKREKILSEWLMNHKF